MLKSTPKVRQLRYPETNIGSAFHRRAAGASLIFMLVLALRRHAAADVPLRLVDRQHVAHLFVQSEVDMAQPLRHILMYR